MTDRGRKGLEVRGNKLQYEELEGFCIKHLELSGGMLLLLLLSQVSHV